MCYKLFLWTIPFVKVGRRGWGGEGARMRELDSQGFPASISVIFPCQVKTKQKFGVSFSFPSIQNYGQKGEFLNLKRKASKWVFLMEVFKNGGGEYEALLWQFCSRRRVLTVPNLGNMYTEELLYFYGLSWPLFLSLSFFFVLQWWLHSFPTSCSITK